ncbi:SRPBCC family protein [Leifsonia sp. C5G2]|uniref:SRPBCC family protein n=1 Tax=Leifsonia sp. C5G2 TaxID=2735269 RepID=UPI0015852B81|nr:SRPBCC family protein [Leifsonia sp. C5G2]NUU06832.1 SRPBCC domain-containing protein [Leifsonia sp. C5G2]
MTTTARAERHVDAPRDRLWHALTDPDTISRYLFGSRVETDWRVGSPILYRGEWDGRPYEDKGTILEIAPGDRLVTSYYSPLSGKPDEPASYQTVSYLLADDGAGTLVTITQDGCADEAEAQRMGANWAAVLESLKSVVEEA